MSRTLRQWSLDYLIFRMALLFLYRYMIRRRCLNRSWRFRFLSWWFFQGYRLLFWDICFLNFWKNRFRVVFLNFCGRCSGFRYIMDRVLEHRSWQSRSLYKVNRRVLNRFIRFVWWSFWSGRGWRTCYVSSLIVCLNCLTKLVLSLPLTGWFNFIIVNLKFDSKL